MDPGRECFRTLIFVSIHHFYHWCWMTPTTMGFFPTRPRTRKRTSSSSSSQSPRPFLSFLLFLFSSSFFRRSKRPLPCSRKFQNVFLSPSRRRRHPIARMISRRLLLREKNKKKKKETKVNKETLLKVFFLSSFVA